MINTYKLEIGILNIDMEAMILKKRIVKKIELL